MIPTRQIIASLCLLLPLTLGACSGHGYDTDASCRRGPPSGMQSGLGRGIHGGLSEGFGGGFGPGGGMAGMMGGNGLAGGMMGRGMGGDGPPDGGFGGHRGPPPDMDQSASRCGPPPIPRGGKAGPQTPTGETHDDVDVSRIQIGGSK